MLRVKDQGVRDTKERVLGETRQRLIKVMSGSDGVRKKVMNEMMRMKRIELFLETNRYSFLWKERGDGKNTESKKKGES